MNQTLSLRPDLRRSSDEVRTPKFAFYRNNVLRQSTLTATHGSFSLQIIVSQPECSSAADVSADLQLQIFDQELKRYEPFLTELFKKNIIRELYPGSYIKVQIASIDAQLGWVVTCVSMALQCAGYSTLGGLIGLERSPELVDPCKAELAAKSGMKLVGVYRMAQQKIILTEQNELEAQPRKRAQAPLASVAENIRRQELDILEHQDVSQQLAAIEALVRSFLLK